MIRLGPFELLRPLEEGGMGVVWRAVHTEQRVPVAVKVISERGLATPTARAAFRDEITAAARLHHPGIILVFDHGEVPNEASIASQGRLHEGAAYVVMEYASFGSLKSRLGEMPWSQLRSTLLSLLDALAHAHARGVVHRDIKPGNILLAGPEDIRPGLKLADFGLARALDRTDDLDAVRGTPLYMASEQLTKRWRDFGPWTDLYALGHVAWELATGRAAFRGRTMPGILNGHLTGSLPPFQPRIDVPEGLHGWLLRMLHPNPAERFQRAADAAWALGKLGDPEHLGSGGKIAGVITNPTLTLDDTMLLLATTHDVPVGMEEVIAVVGAKTEPAAVEAPPMLKSWKRPEPPAPPVHLLGVGLGLFGLRAIPLVGRVSERNTIWDRLWKVKTGNRPQAVSLVGAAGNGKTRLVEWISQRAHEVGGTHVLKAVHSPDPTPLDGITPMVTRWTRCMGLDRQAVRARLTPRLPEAELEPLLELLQPAAPEEETAVRLVERDERFLVVLEVLERAARDRPVILWLDDVQWGHGALEFVAWMLERRPAIQILVLMTAQAEALAERDRERAALEAICEREEAVAIAIGPLSRSQAEKLVRHLLGLDKALVARLAERTRGNPLFTIQLVGDWVARGILVPGASGFGLREGAAVELPDTLHEVWSERLERLVQHHVEGTLRALEIAAALGQDIEESEWTAICQSAGVPVDPALVDAMKEARLAVATDVGWSFSHGMLRESLIRLARERNRWTTANSLCAIALATHEPIPDARLGRHWLAAGDYETAAKHLGDALKKIPEDSSGGHTYRGLLDALEESLRRGQFPESDARWGGLWLAKARSRLTREELDEAQRDVMRTEQFARRHHWPHRAAANLLLARLSHQRGNIHDSDGLYQRAIPMLRDTGDHKVLAAGLVRAANARILSGKREGAQQYLTEARGLFESLGDLGGIATVIRYEGDIARLESRYVEARDLFLEASEMNRRAGLRGSASNTLHGVAEMDRLLGNFDAAEPVYWTVIEDDQARGRRADVPRLNLALCLIGREKYTEAREQLLVLQQLWRDERKRGWEGIAQATLMHAAAGMGDWGSFDEHAMQAAVLCPQTGMVDLDLALAGEAASTLAAAAGETSRAKEALEFAISQWELLGDEPRTADAMARLDRL